MSPRSKKEYIEVTSLRYKKASRKRKTAILDEFYATCQCHHKHAIRILRSFRRFIKPNIKKWGRTPLYHKESILKPLKQIWLAANLPQDWGSGNRNKVFFLSFLGQIFFQLLFMIYPLSPLL
jgi:hypothetical protein